MSSLTVYGESRGEPWEGWKAVVATVFNRVDDRAHSFPNTIVEVVLQPRPNGKGCEYDSRCDKVKENLINLKGMEITSLVLLWVFERYYGLFDDPTHGAHSFCTPKACKGNLYFQRKVLEKMRVGNHVFFGPPPIPKRKPKYS